MTSSKILLSARCLLHGPARLSKSPDGDHVGCGVNLAGGARSFRYQEAALENWGNVPQFSGVANAATLPVPCGTPSRGSQRTARPRLSARHASTGVVLCWAFRRFF
jgi:hypothetical protein